LSILALAALVLALIALSRTGKGGDLAVRVKQLEEELARVRAQLARGGLAVSPPEDAAAHPAESGATDEMAVPGAADESAAPGSPKADRPLRPWWHEPARAGDAAHEPAGAGDAAHELDDRAAGAGEVSRELDDRAAGAAESLGGIAVPPGGLRPPLEPPGPPPPSFLSQVDWERWLGVRGAAVLGGVALALAGLFFFRYSIEHGLIPPWLRVVVGVLAGLLAIGGAEWSLRQRYAGTANALAGGGLVILYAAFWAAGTLYDLIPLGAVFVLMVVVTVAGCVLSWRHASLVIAVIGLAGGFLTPVFASRGGDHPIGLFGYVLLLDVGVLLLARRMGWPLLGLLALAGTTAYQLLWIGGRMGPERVLLGLALLGVFGVLFAVASPARREGEEDGTVGDARAWRLAQWLGVLVPLVTAIYFAASSDLDTGIVPLGALLAVLGLAAGWLARQHGEALLGLGAAAATLGVAAVWVVQNPSLDGTPWTVALTFVVLAAAHHATVELARRDAAHAREAAEEADTSRERAGQAADSSQAADASQTAAVARAPLVALANAATLVGLGLLLLLVLAGALRTFALPPLLAGWLGIAALLVRQATFPGRGRVQVAAAAAVACGLALYRLNVDGPDVAPSYALVVPAMLLVAIAWQGVALLQRALASHRSAEHAAATLAVVLLLGWLPDPSPEVLVGLGVPCLLGFLALLAATRLGGGAWLLVATLATALVQLGWTMDRHPVPSGTGLALAFLSAALFTAWPLVAAGRLRDDRWSWRASALAPLAWLPAVGTLFEDRFGAAAIGLVPIALGALAVAAAARARTLWPDDEARRTSALAWLCGAALSLLTIAIPLQVEKEWITIGWALEGAALLVLWTRLDHPGLKYTGLALLLAATARLVGNPEVLAYHPRPAWRIVNWLAYAYLVPAAALVASARLLVVHEVARLRSWEEPLYLRRSAPLAAGIVGLAALLVVFVWINLAIADWFSTGDQLRLLAARTPAEKLVLSIAWALYAVVLLVLGVRLKVGSLRWASLALLLLTIGKIFLYDVGELSDLYRVGALLGLALSLIAVSLVYQRFVFRRSAEEVP